MFEAIAKPFGWLMLQLYNLTGNYGIAVILFALVVKVILLPFQLKSKKSMMRTSRMTPRLKELEKKFGNDRARYQQEMQKLYKEEGVNPMSGCIWSLIPFPILIALYQAIRKPLTIMMGVASSLLAEGGDIYLRLSEEVQKVAGNGYGEIYQSQYITAHFSDFAGITDKLQKLDYSFLGINLGDVPNWQFWTWGNVSWATFGLFLIPIVSAALSYFSMKISSATNPQADATGQSNKTMMVTMPLISLIFCFMMPGVMGIYWIAQSVFSIIQDYVLTRIFNKQLDIEDADRIAREKAREAELEAKREETERLRAEGLTVENKNTSKKNKKAIAAQKEAERRAAEARAQKAKKRAAMGIVDDTPASQVGNRRYARGRAYVPDRYSNPEEAEEKTRAAAEESETYALQHPEPEEADLPETEETDLPEAEETDLYEEEEVVELLAENAGEEAAEDAEEDSFADEDGEPETEEEYDADAAEDAEDREAYPAGDDADSE